MALLLLLLLLLLILLLFIYYYNYIILLLKDHLCYLQSHSVVYVLKHLLPGYRLELPTSGSVCTKWTL